MATTKSQRIGIWIIAVFLLVGSIGTILIAVLSMTNSQTDKERYDTLLAQYQEDVAKQTKELSDEYFPTFSPYLSRVSTFDAAGVTELGKNDLVVGTGDDVTSGSTFTAYYIGWTPDGVIFDSTFNEDKTALTEPYTVKGGGVIEGWLQGVDGMKVGGIRELSIPSGLAYKEAGFGEKIGPNTPLKFVLMLIPTPETIEPSQELITLHARINGNGQ